MVVIKNLQKEIENTQVIILTGGKAKRMGNVDKPKALLELNGKPLLQYTLKWLTDSGFRDFVFLLGHRHEEIENYVENSGFDINVTYSVEPETVKGKGKALKYALQNNKIDKDRRALVCFPDDLFLDKTLPVELILRHMQGIKNYNTIGTLVFVSGTKYSFGVGEIDENQLVSSFTEKPFISKHTSTGLYLIEPEVFKEIEENITIESGESIEFENAILPRLAEKKKLFSLTLPYSVWIPINTIKDLEKTQEILKDVNLC